MKISEILRKAANEFLWDARIGSEGCMCSCIAVMDAAPNGQSRKALRFLESLGCSPTSLFAFDEFKFGRKRQGARYAWLMFAAQYAEELGK